MKIVLIDNFDSFSYNLVHYLEQVVEQVEVVTNLSVNLDELHYYDAVVLSPGPGLPQESGKLMEALAVAIEQRIPVLGVCLGMQAIGVHFGDELYNQQAVKHGVATQLKTSGESILYTGLPETFAVGLYHSWAVRLSENSPLKSTAFSEEDVLMSVEHPDFPVWGVQYHPESILSEHGLEILRNFVRSASK